MTEPTVCCVMLTRDRPAMAKRAVESFRRQTYRNRRLLIWDRSDPPLSFELMYDPPEWHAYQVPPEHKTIGSLRNDACEDCKAAGAEIICHWDDDDLSHPNRIAEQVALLQASGADAVGYSDLLFWDTRARLIDPGLHDMDSFEPANEAWLYSRPTRLNVPGTTLMYKRSVWEREPFPHLPEVGNPASQGEDVVWQAGLKVVAVSSILSFPKDENVIASSREPRMIASVHSGNTMAAGYSHMCHVEEFRRVPLWDAYCERTMKL